MPKTTWDDDEAQFLKQSVKEWESLRESDLVNKFYRRFPDRDVDQQPESDRLFTQEQRNQLAKRVRKYLNNQRRAEPKVINTNEKIGNKTTTARSLFKSEYSELVLARRDKVLEEDPTLDPLVAYNKALALEWEGLRSDAQGGIDQQTPEMQKRMLDALPSEIAPTLDAWGRKYNMVSYIVAVWESTEGETEAFDYASTRARSYLKTADATKHQKSFEGRVTEHVGGVISQSDSSVSLQIYPGQNEQPMLPPLEPKTPVKIKIQLLRRYFNAKYESQGGIELSWKQLEQESVDENPHAIDTKRMPMGITHLCDPSRMTAPQINSWIDHIHKGQKRLPDDNLVFQFQVLKRGPKNDPLIQSELQSSTHPLSKLRYMPAERRFAQRYLADAVAVNMGPDLDTRWSGLPLARSIARYRAIEEWALGSLDSWGGTYVQVADLLRDIALMEMKGPAHRMTLDASMSELANNPHLLATAAGSSDAFQTEPDWLPLEFFDHLNPNHYDWSLLSLLFCIKRIRPHIHSESKTVLGGPYGVRILGLTLRRIALNIRRIEARSSVPDTLMSAIQRSSPHWATEAALEQLSQCVLIIWQDIEQSNGILSRSLSERTSMWIDQITRLHQEYELRGEKDATAPDGSDRSSTNGLPRSLQEAHTIWLLQETAHSAAMVPPSQGTGGPSRTTRHMRYCSAQRVNSPSSDSHENISLPSDDELSGSSRAASPGSPEGNDLSDGSVHRPDVSFRHVEVQSLRVDSLAGASATSDISQRDSYKRSPLGANPDADQHAEDNVAEPASTGEALDNKDTQSRVELAEDAPRSVRQKKGARRARVGTAEDSSSAAAKLNDRPKRSRARLPQAQAAIDAASKGKYKR
ncbi:hypothetical protein BDV93DRAFT_555272 [Ceratobasidium sp. AG-I]|nr:hypothetical protein BDV93DRAFT_555272 [Ceratobasidium sp. AG-I]